MATTTATPSAPACSWLDTLGGVFWGSKRIVAAHTRHFLALSVLFLLPLSLFLIAAPTFASLLRPAPFLPPQTLLRVALREPLAAPVALSAAFAAAAGLLALCAAAAVTRSVQDGFFGRPVRLAAALRSLPSSLWRLILTSLCAAAALAAYAAIIVSTFLLFLHVLPLLGLHNTHLYPAVSAAAAAALALGAVYLQVNWALAGAVAVAESNWGFEPLRRSAHLVRGMRWGVLCLVLFFSAGIGLVLWRADLGLAVEDWRGAAPVVARVVCASAVTVVLFLYSLVSTTVLYIYCKALHGELADEIAEEFAGHYVRLPFDDRKLPHIVSVV